MLLVALGTAGSLPTATAVTTASSQPFQRENARDTGTRDTFLIFQAVFRLVDCSREALAPEIVFCGKLENKILERKGAEQPFREFLAGW